MPFFRRDKRYDNVYKVCITSEAYWESMEPGKESMSATCSPLHGGRALSIIPRIIALTLSPNARSVVSYRISGGGDRGYAFRQYPGIHVWLHLRTAADGTVHGDCVDWTGADSETLALRW